MLLERMAESTQEVAEYGSERPGNDQTQMEQDQVHLLYIYIF
jgi:hypothetical protein